MKIEITHDIIAKKIFDKGTEQEKAFLRANRLVKERRAAYKDTKTLLTARELEFIEPQEAELQATLSETEWQFVRRSKRARKWQLAKKIAIAASIGLIIGISALYLSTYYNKKFAEWLGVSSRSNNLVGEALMVMDKNPTVAVNFIAEALRLDDQNKSAKQVLYLLHRDNIFIKDILYKKLDANAIAFSPNSRLVACAESDTVYIRSVADPNLTFKRRLHKGTINDLFFESDSVLISVGDDNRAMRWRFFENDLSEIYQGAHTLPVNNLDFDLNAVKMSVDKRFVLLGRGNKASDCLLMDYDLDTTYVIDDAGGRVHDVAFSIPDPKATEDILKKMFMVTVGDDRIIMVYDAATRKILAQSDPAEHVNSIFSLAISPRGKEIVTASNHDVIQVFELEKNKNPKLGTPYTLKLKERLTGHRDIVRSVRFSTDGTKMVSASSDKTAIIWNTNTWEIDYQLKGHEARVFKAEFSPDGRYVMTCGRDSSVIIWNLSLKFPKSFPERYQRRVSALVPSEDGSILFSGTWGNEKTPFRTLVAWDAKDYVPLAVDTFNNDIETLCGYHKNSVLVASGTRLYLRDYEHGRLAPIGQAQGTIKAIAVANDRKFVAYAGRDGKVRIWYGINKEKEYFVDKDTEKDPVGRHIYALGISADNRYIVAGRRNASLVIWDVKAGKQFIPFTGHDALYRNDNEIYTVTFVDDNRFLTTGRDNTIRLWQIGEDGKLRTLYKIDGHAGGIRCLALHPSKSMFITGGGDKTVKIWDIGGNLIQVFDAYYGDNAPCTGDELKCRDDFGVVTAVTFSKNGDKIILGNGNGSIKVLQTIEGAMRQGEIYSMQ